MSASQRMKRTWDQNGSNTSTSLDVVMKTDRTNTLHQEKNMQINSLKSLNALGMDELANRIALEIPPLKLHSLEVQRQPLGTTAVTTWASHASPRLAHRSADVGLPSPVVEASFAFKDLCLQRCPTVRARGQHMKMLKIGRSIESQLLRT